MFQDIKRPHLIGIGGIGVSAIARWFLYEGKTVTGSDLVESALTHTLESSGVKVYSGHAASNLDENVDLVIYSPAVPEDNVERVLARERGVREFSYAEFLGEISKQFSTIVVTGTNGKSTTTAMLGLILEAAGYDPTVIVGSLVPEFKDGNFRAGKGRFFVVEGCEYRANMCLLEPEMIVLTNIEEDHLDYYRDIKHIQETFQSFVDKLQGKGLTIYNVNDEGTRSLQIPRGIGFGVDVTTDYVARNRQSAQGSQSAAIYRKEGEEVYLGDLTMQVPGEFNLENALAATAAAMELGVPFETCRRVLVEFVGIWRRFERVGVWKGADVISDYGHHPTAIAGTLKAAREFFPGRRIVLCYQPHQHNRTKELFNDFVSTLRFADHLIITEIYDVAGRNENDDVSSKDIVDAIGKKDAAKDVRFAKDFAAAESELRDLIKPNDVLIIMGAGNIDELARKLS